MFFCTGNLRQVNLHDTAGVIIDQQVVIASCRDESVVLGTVLNDDALVRNPLEVGESQDQLPEEFHLLEARIVEGLIPGLHIACITIARRITWLQHLHDGVVAIGMSATAGKDTPVGITPDVTGPPVGFILVVQPHGDVLIRRFGIEYGLDGLVGPG